MSKVLNREGSIMSPKDNEGAEKAGKDLTIISHGVDKEKEIPDWMIEEDREILSQAPLPSPRKRGRPKSDKPVKPDKIPLHRVEYDLIDWMVGENVPPDLQEAAPFPTRFRTYFQDDTKRDLELIEVVDNVATIASEQMLYDEIKTSVKNFRGKAAQYQLPHRQLEQLAKSFIKEPMRYRLKQAPVTFCWESQREVISFNRVPDPAPNCHHFYGSPEFREKAPVWSDFIDRNEEKNAVRAFFGLLLNVGSPHKQSLHFCGDPDAGKTTMIEVLLECFFGQRGYAAFEPTFEGDNFYKEEWVGKLAMFADELPDWFYRTNDYKKLTGAVKHRINVKHKSAYRANISAKLIATSNQRPSLPPDRAVCERLIISHVQSLPGDKIDASRDRLKSKILKEIPYIIADCLEAYKLLNGNRIKVSEDNHEESLETYAAPMQDLFDRYFKHAPGQRTEISLFRSVIVRFGDKVTNYAQMKAFVAHKYNSSFGVIRDKKTRWVTNISVKPGALVGLNVV